MRIDWSFVSKSRTFAKQLQAMNLYWENLKRAYYYA